MSLYMLVSLPNSAPDLTTVPEGTVQQFKVPDFKIGSVDTLIQQADDLAKLDGVCQGVVSKIGDVLRNLLEGDDEKISQQKTVNDSMCLHFRL